MKTLLLLAAALLAFTLSVGAQEGPPPPPPGGPGHRPPPPPKFEDLDADANGAVSLEEFLGAWTARHEEEFSRFDADENGTLSSDELPQGPPPGRGPRRGGPEGQDGPPPPREGDRPGPPPGDRPGPPPGRMHPPKLEALDGNQDGKITQEEFLAAWEAALQEHFSELDANADGTLEQDELPPPPPPHRGPRGGQGEPRGQAPSR